MDAESWKQLSDPSPTADKHPPPAVVSFYLVDPRGEEEPARVPGSNEATHHVCSIRLLLSMCDCSRPMAMRLSATMQRKEWMPVWVRSSLSPASLSLCSGSASQQNNLHSDSRGPHRIAPYCDGGGREKKIARPASSPGFVRERKRGGREVEKKAAHKSVANHISTQCRCEKGVFHVPPAALHDAERDMGKGETGH